MQWRKTYLMVLVFFALAAADLQITPIFGAPQKSDRCVRTLFRSALRDQTIVKAGDCGGNVCRFLKSPNVDPTWFRVILLFDKDLGEVKRMITRKARQDEWWAAGSLAIPPGWRNHVVLERGGYIYDFAFKDEQPQILKADQYFLQMFGVYIHGDKPALLVEKKRNRIVAITMSSKEYLEIFERDRNTDITELGRSGKYRLRSLGSIFSRRN